MECRQKVVFAHWLSLSKAVSGVSSQEAKFPVEMLQPEVPLLEPCCPIALICRLILWQESLAMFTTNASEVPC